MRTLAATTENIRGVLTQSAGLELAPDMRAVDMDTDLVTYRLDRTARTGYFAIRAGSLFTLYRPQPDTYNDGQFITQINLHENRRILKDHLHPLYFDVEADDTPKDLVARSAAAVIGGSYDVARAEEIKDLLRTAMNTAIAAETKQSRPSLSTAPEIFPN